MLNGLIGRTCFALLLGLPFVLGCGGGSSFKTVPVSGKVMCDDKPVTSGQVVLVPLDGKPPKEASSGPIDSSGGYTIKTGTKDGAPVGKYKVQVMPGGSMAMVPTGDKPPPPPPYSLTFSDPQKTTLQIEVVESPKPGAYDLKLTK
jgi:hypothetical protein